MNRILLTTALAMLLCSNATAQNRVKTVPIVTGEDTTPLLPPPEFDKPFTGTFMLFHGESVAEVAHFCNREGRTILGCSRRFVIAGEAFCRVMVAPDYVIQRQGIDPAHVLRHEIGHCNGWPGSHPTATGEVTGATPFHPIYQCPVIQYGTRDCSN